MFPYILQVTLCWTVFYLLYLSLLRKETFFHVNRWYLLSTLVIGVLLPLIEWQPSPVIEAHPTYENAIQPIQVQMLQLEQSIEAVSQPFILDFMDVLLAFYLSGVLFFLALLLHGLWKIWKLYHASEVAQQGKIKVIYTPETHLPFSFFHLLFWSKNYEAALPEKAQILRHEEAHIHQWHTLDVLFLEVLNILFWCSPIIYFYRKSLRRTHEYLADALVLKNTKRKEYGHLLLKQSLSGVQIALANHFIHSQLKDRILMMTRNKSRKRNLMKYLPLLPILLLAILVFAKHDGLQQAEKMMGSFTEIEASFDEKKIEADLLELAKRYKAFRGETITGENGFAKFATDYKEIIDAYPSQEAKIAEMTKDVFKTLNLDITYEISPLQKLTSIEFLNSEGHPWPSKINLDDRFDVTSSTFRSLDQLDDEKNTFKDEASSTFKQLYLQLSKAKNGQEQIDAFQKFTDFLDDLYDEYTEPPIYLINTFSKEAYKILGKNQLPIEYRIDNQNRIIAYLMAGDTHLKWYKDGDQKFLKVYESDFVIVQKLDASAQDDARTTDLRSTQLAYQKVDWSAYKVAYRSSTFRENTENEIFYRFLDGKDERISYDKDKVKVRFSSSFRFEDTSAPSSVFSEKNFSILKEGAYIDLIHPIKDRSKITKEVSYGMREHPVHKDQRLHTGVDYIVPMGTEVVATADGKVVVVKKWKEGYGNHITIKHAEGYSTFYAHLDDMLVKEGQQVKQGQVIALSGNTGTSTGPHLHYEVRLNGEPIDFAYTPDVPQKKEFSSDGAVITGYGAQGKGTNDYVDALTEFGKSQSYNETYIAQSFAAVFLSPNLTLSERSTMLTEDYQLFTARFAEKEEAITDMLVKEVFMRGLEVKILEEDHQVILRAKGLGNQSLPKKGDLVRVVFKPEMSKADLEELRQDLAIKGIQLDIQSTAYDDKGNLVGLKYRMSDRSGSVLHQTGMLEEREELGFYTYLNTGAMGTLPLDQDNRFSNQKIFKVVEEMPRFPSDECEAMTTNEARNECAQTAFLKYLYTNLKYPAAARQASIQGVNVIQFIIEKDGRLSNFKILRDIGGGCGEEALRVMKKMNSDDIRWIPGVQNGEKVAVEYTVPVKYMLQGGTQDTDEQNLEIRDDSEEVFKVVEQMPRFPSEECEALENDLDKKSCSDKALMNYIVQYIKYPEAAREAKKEGMCVVQFTVEKDGSLSDIDLVRDIGAGCGEEAKSIVEQMNIDNLKWTPGIQRGRKVRVRFTLPIKFELGAEDETQESPDLPIEVEELLVLHQFELAPNPSSGDIQVRFQAATEPIAIKIYDAKGSILYQEAIPNFSGTYNERLQLKNTSKGIHFLVIEQQGKTFVKQLVME
ncbi:MAG: TonB family protein [Bacteroidota bacterium]